MDELVEKGIIKSNW